MRALQVFKILIITLSVGLVFSNAVGQIPTDGLVGYYPFNGNANDESGNHYDGAPYNVLLISDRFGAASAAYSFNGEYGFIELPTAFDLLPRTIDLWFNLSETYQDSVYGAVYQSDYPGLNYGNTGIAVKVIDGSKKLLMTINAVTDTVDIAPNIWYNVAVVARQNNEISYYLNGSLMKTKVYTGFVTSDNGLPYAIVGANRILSENYFNGIIDDIRIYNRALNQREITQIFNEGACANSINVMDTLVIYANLLGSNPLLYQNLIKVYPNPSSDYLNIDCGSNYSLLSSNSIKITNAAGQTVFISPVNQQYFHLNL